MENLREYETVFVLDPSLEGEAIDGQIDRVVKIIEERQGEIKEVQRWGRRRLAYPIRKKTEGVYTFIRFIGNNSALDELERRFMLNESLLRHLTVLCEYVPTVTAKAAVPAGLRSEARGAADADVNDFEGDNGDDEENGASSDDSANDDWARKE
jgi:small subunit ribosomal protein S6